MATNQSPELVPPIVVDLGKARRRQLKDLKQGRGKLADEVHDVVARVRDDLGASANGIQFVPVVIIYKRKSKKKKRRGLGLPLGLPLPGF